MFSNSDSFDFDDFQKGHSHHLFDDSELDVDPGPIMEIVVTIVTVVGIAIVLALCCKCCCNNKNKGRVLQPPPDSAAPPLPPGPGVYPQQQYNTVTVPTVVPSHNVTSYPTSAVPYPSTGAYPAPAPYPTGGAPYPTGGAPYPTGGAPYPAVAPYPTSTPYGGMPLPQPLPQPHSAPSAPEAHAFIGVAAPGWHPQALPPSYDQVMSSETAKHPPYNPYAPH